MADKSAAITFARTVTPSQQPSEARANDGGNDSVAILVTFDHSRRFIFTEKTMGRDEMLSPDCYFFVGLRLNVPKPVRIRTKSICYDDLRTLVPVLDDFKHGLPPDTSTASCMGQQQQAFSKMNKNEEGLSRAVRSIFQGCQSTRIQKQTKWPSSDHGSSKQAVEYRVGGLRTLPLLRHLRVELI